MVGRGAKHGRGIWLLAVAATSLAVALAITAGDRPPRIRSSSAPGEPAILPSLERVDEDPFAVGRSPAASRIPVQVGEVGAIDGIVSDLSGAMLPTRSVRIEAVHENGTRISRGLPPEGDYAFRSLAFGRWSVRALLGRSAGSAVEVELSAHQPRARADLLVERTHPVQVLLRTPSDSRLEEELRRSGMDSCAFPRLVAREQPQGFPPHECSGVFLGPARDTRLWLSAEHAMHVGVVLGDRVFGERLIWPSDETVTLLVDPDRILAALSRLALRLVDAQSGAPLRGGRARVETRGAAPCEYEAGEDGDLSIERCPPGDLVLWLEAAGRERRMLEIHLAPTEFKDLGPVELRKGWCAEGLVLDPAGEPSSEALCLARRDEGGGWSLVESYSKVRSSTTGRFAIDGLGPGSYRIGRGTDHDPWTEFQIDSAPALDLRVEVVPSAKASANGSGRP